LRKCCRRPQLIQLVHDDADASNDNSNHDARDHSRQEQSVLIPNTTDDDVGN
jgi:hypothetical protein